MFFKNGNKFYKMNSRSLILTCLPGKKYSYKSNPHFLLFCFFLCLEWKEVNSNLLRICLCQCHMLSGRPNVSRIQSILKFSPRFWRKNHNLMHLIWSCTSPGYSVGGLLLCPFLPLSKFDVWLFLFLLP